MTARTFEVEQNGQISYLVYELDELGWITLWHTEVPQALRGQGLGAKLLRMAFDYAEANHLTVEPICPFAASFVARHPEVRYLVGRRSATGLGPGAVA